MNRLSYHTVLSDQADAAPMVDASRTLCLLSTLLPLGGAMISIYSSPL
ncbi:MAG: hypothetical protein HQL53_04905 [Magnetococcales bacterium]|nr:hypothetical protein [Magnetococcales bacterium]